MDFTHFHAFYAYTLARGFHVSANSDNPLEDGILGTSSISSTSKLLAPQILDYIDGLIERKGKLSGSGIDQPIDIEEVSNNLFKQSQSDELLGNVSGNDNLKGSKDILVGDSSKGDVDVLTGLGSKTESVESILPIFNLQPKSSPVVTSDSSDTDSSNTDSSEITSSDTDSSDTDSSEITSSDTDSSDTDSSEITSSDTDSSDTDSSEITSSDTDSSDTDSSDTDSFDITFF